MVDLHLQLERVLKAAGVPLHGVPEEGDRGDLTSDLYSVVKPLVFTGRQVQDRTLPARTLTDEQGEFTVPGERPETWKERAEKLEAEVQRLRPWANLVADLDRCEHGRHEGDVCSGVHPLGCNGPSRGNPIEAAAVMDPARRRDHHSRVEWWAEQMNDGVVPGGLIGFTVHARPICVPSRESMSDPEAWK